MAVHSDYLHLWKYFILLKNFKAECKICKQAFTVCHIKLIKHLCNMHYKTIDKVYDGEIPRKNDADWKWQYYNIEGNIAKCNICDKSLKFLSSANILLNHLRLKHSEKIVETRRMKSFLEPYCTYLEKYKVQCKFCDKIINIASRNKNFVRHLRVKHPEITYKSKKENLDWIQQYFKVENNKARCNLCDGIYSVRWGLSYLRKHLIKVHQINNTKTNKNTKINKATKQLAKEDVADTSFHQTVHLISTVLHSKIENDEKESFGYYTEPVQ